MCHAAGTADVKRTPGRPKRRPRLSAVKPRNRDIRHDRGELDTEGERSPRMRTSAKVYAERNGRPWIKHNIFPKFLVGLHKTVLKTLVRLACSTDCVELFADTPIRHTVSAVLSLEPGALPGRLISLRRVSRLRPRPPSAARTGRSSGRLRRPSLPPSAAARASPGLPGFHI